MIKTESPIFEEIFIRNKIVSLKVIELTETLKKKC